MIADDTFNLNGRSGKFAVSVSIGLIVGFALPTIKQLHACYYNLISPILDQESFDLINYH